MHAHRPVMAISLMVRAAMLSVISVAGIPSATASYAVSLDPWLYGLVSVQYTRFSLPSEWRLRTTPTHRQSYYHSYGSINILTTPFFSHHTHSSSLTECGPVSSCGQGAGVAVCKDGHRVPWDTRQDVLGTIVTNLPVIIDVTL